MSYVLVWKNAEVVEAKDGHHTREFATITLAKQAAKEYSSSGSKEIGIYKFVGWA